MMQRAMGPASLLPVASLPTPGVPSTSTATAISGSLPSGPAHAIILACELGGKLTPGLSAVSKECHGLLPALLIGTLRTSID